VPRETLSTSVSSLIVRSAGAAVGRLAYADAFVRSAMPKTLPLSALARVPLGVSNVSWTRVLVDDADEPSWVQFMPAELAPFSLKISFHYVESGESPEDAERRWWWVSTETIPPAPPAIVEWTWEQEQELRRHSLSYRRLAECLIDVEFDTADDVRSRMLALGRAVRRKGSAKLTPLERVALQFEVNARQRAGEDKQEIAVALGISRSTLYRRLSE
jgi:hypothetical protein